MSAARASRPLAHTRAAPAAGGFQWKVFLREIIEGFRGTKAAIGAGAEAERLAASWLERERRFTILARNWRSPRDRRDEIDLVARDGDVLVFVEVKSRPADALVPGYVAAAHPRKKKVVFRAARQYIRALRDKPRTIRYDIVEVATQPGVDPDVRHYGNVELFPKSFLRGLG